MTLVLHSVCLSKIFQRTYFRFKSESGCKGKWFIFTVQIFLKFFQKYFSDKFRNAFLAPLRHGKVRYSDIPKSLPDFCHYVIVNHFPSRKRVQNYALFSFTQYFTTLFFQKNYGLTLNLLLISEKYTETFYWYITAAILCCRTYTLLLISMDNRLYRKLCTGL